MTSDTMSDVTMAGRSIAQGAMIEGSMIEGSATRGKYPCPQCSHSFTRRHNLKSHLLTHTLSRPFNCHICSSKFRRLHDLKRHEKLHTGERPFNCEKCGRRFARADALVRHMNSMQGCSSLDEDQGDERQFEGQFKVMTVGATGPTPSNSLPSVSISLPASASVQESEQQHETEGTHAIITTDTTGSERSQDKDRNEGVMAYVEMLELRVATLETRLGQAELKLAKLTP